MTEKKEHLMLKWSDDSSQFVPIKSDEDMDDGIFLELANEEKWRYFYIKGASLVSRRTALRVANGISKAGYLHPQTNIRYGVECELKEEISAYEDMPESLRTSQRSWYKGE